MKVLSKYILFIYKLVFLNSNIMLSLKSSKSYLSLMSSKSLLSLDSGKYHLSLVNSDSIRVVTNK